jgi:two-component system sensor histidine kinase FlrB
MNNMAFADLTQRSNSSLHPDVMGKGECLPSVLDWPVNQPDISGAGNRPKAQQELNELRAQASRMRHLVDILPSGVVVLDGNGVVCDANRIAIDLLNEPLLGERWLNVIQRSFSPRADDGHEVSLKDGRRVKLDITALTPEPGQLILITDLTETRRLQESISQMQRLSALGKMVASLAHQIRTPLSAAMLYGSNLGSRTLTADARRTFADKLVARLTDLEQQVNDMLLFARSGDNPVVDEVSMQGLLAQVQQGVEAMVLQNHCSLTVEMPDPDLMVFGNKNSLASALCNLVHNSIQAGGSGCRIHLRGCLNDKGEVEVAVLDNGPGIPEAIQQKVLDPFYTTRSHGTGLGLAVVKAVAKSHQGKVSLASKEGQGTCVAMQIPVHRIGESDRIKTKVVGG